MNIGWPESIWFAIASLNLLANFAYDGEPRKGKYSAPWSIIGCAMAFALLYWGGFFA